MKLLQGCGGPEPIPLWAHGREQPRTRMGCQPIAGYTHIEFTHTWTVTGKLVAPINLSMFEDCEVKLHPEKSPKRHRRICKLHTHGSIVKTRTLVPDV